MSLAEISRIVKHRHDTGAYGDAHFEMGRQVFDLLGEQSPPAATRQPWEPTPLGDLLAIPIRIDETLPPGEWRLVSNAGELLLSGEIRCQDL